MKDGIKIEKSGRNLINEHLGCISKANLEKMKFIRIFII